MKAIEANADSHAANELPIIREIQRVGAKSLRAADGAQCKDKFPLGSLFQKDFGPASGRHRTTALKSGQSPDWRMRRTDENGLIEKARQRIPQDSSMERLQAPCWSAPLIASLV